MKLKPADRVQPSGKNKLFDTSKQSYEKIETEQKDIAVPRNTVSNIMPLRNRTQKVVEMSDQIAEVLAKRMEPVKGTNVQFFYHTGPLIAKAVSMGIPKEKAVDSLKKFALNYAVTSPRTMTEQNLRNASLVSVKENLNKSLDTLLEAEMMATIQTIKNKNLPIRVLILKSLNEKQMGSLMMFFFY